MSLLRVHSRSGGDWSGGHGSHPAFSQGSPANGQLYVMAAASFVN